MGTPRWTSLQDRVAIHALSTAGQSDRQIAAALGWTVATVRKWRRIAQRQGTDHLTSRMGRPAGGALSTLTADQRALIQRLRTQHPGWGPVTLRVELSRDPAWGAEPVPSRARLAAFLRQEGLSRRNQKRRPLPQPAPTTATHPHAEWQMDAQGPTPVAGVGTVSVINIADVVSRLKVESYPAVATTQPSMADYQLVLRRAFTQFGLPDRLTLDHGSAFYDNTSPSPYPTRLHLWILALGITVGFIRTRRPTDHALIERGHQTMTGQALTGQTWADADALQIGLDDRRHHLNTIIPSRVLGGQAPLQVYPDATRSGRSYRPEWEPDLLDMTRVDPYLAQGHWFRSSNCHGEFWLGSYRYNLGRTVRSRQIAIQYDPTQRELVCQPDGTGPARRLPIKGVSVAEVMGELTPLVLWPAYQYALPLSHETWRQLEVARSLG